MFVERGSIAPYVASPTNVVRKMLEYSNLKPGETLFDLGCGDGRIVIMAAKEFGAFGIGVDLNKRLVIEASRKSKEYDLGEKIRFIHGNLFNIDLSLADVVTMYLTTGANEKVRPKLEHELKYGARVVTHDFSIPNWDAENVLKFREGYRSHAIYRYKWHVKK